MLSVCWVTSMRVNIIGAGLAGLSAALALAKEGIECNLFSVQQSERAQSVMAEGGINAVLDTMNEDDKIEYHIKDTMDGGANLADPNAVDGLCHSAPGIVRELEQLGVPFGKNEKGIVQRSFGGQKKKRTAFVKSSTGKMLMTAMIDAVREYEAKGLVYRYPHHRLEDLIVRRDECCGAVISDIFTGDVYEFYGSVIMATGGMNGLFEEMTTGSMLNTSDAAAIALERGVELANLEFIQYHPTTIAIQGKRMLISEAARGEGGRLYVKRRGYKWYFMEEKYPELKNLMPRDVVSAEMVKVTSRAECDDQAFLDMTEIPEMIWNTRLSDLREQCINYLNIDPVSQPVPVSPGIHYFMGGVRVDEEHRTSLANCYAAGECACQYHGANRLGGNSLLGAIYGGKIAAQSVLKYADRDALYRRNALEDVPAQNVSPSLSKRITEILASSLQIIRHEATLNNSIKEIKMLLTDDINSAERRRLHLAQAVLLSAKSRRESRGAHKRTDYPEKDEVNFHKLTVARMNGDEVEITFLDIPERRETENHGNTD